MTSSYRVVNFTNQTEFVFVIQNNELTHAHIRKFLLQCRAGPIETQERLTNLAGEFRLQIVNGPKAILSERASTSIQLNLWVKAS